MSSITEYAQTILVILGAGTAMLVAAGGVYRKGLRPMHVKMTRLLELTEYELTPNGGASLADKVNHIASNAKIAEGHWTHLRDGQLQMHERLDKIDDAVNLTGVALREREKELLERIMALDALRSTVETLHAKVEELHRAALAKAEAREIPPEPTEAPSGSAILPRQVVALEPPEEINERPRFHPPAS